MKLTEPLPLHHSWPIAEANQRLDLGLVTDGATPSPLIVHRDLLDRTDIGRWACDLADQSLTWSSGVYDLFGLPRDTAIARVESVRFYSEASRAAMERLRAYAIRHRRGFTLDAQIRPAQGAERWMRLMATPICEGNQVIRIEGLKMDVTSVYH